MYNLDDPDERRRSLGTRSASIDPLETFRYRYIETPSRATGGLSAADLKVAFIRVKEELEQGKLSDNQYNLIIKQLIQVKLMETIHLLFCNYILYNFLWSPEYKCLINAFEVLETAFRYYYS